MTDTQGRDDLVPITIDGTAMEVPKGTLVIRAAEQLGITIPRFCDHPLLDPVAACRQCMVEIHTERGPMPKPMAACSTTVMPGMEVMTQRTSDMASQAQESCLELLLVNHPLDCPMCDKGGECPLQDQTLAHGPGFSRFVDSKRRFLKPLPISELVALDRERCVLCARCTRFSQEISGDPFIELFERGALEQVAIYEDEPYHSYFSGNVVQICPVGALTATPYRFKSRPFDLRSADGICTQCSVGCNLRIDVRRGEIQRQLAGENMAVNEMWSCDKGRFGFTYVAHPDRLTHPEIRNDVGARTPTSWVRAMEAAGAQLSDIIETHGPDAVGVITGGRLTDEDAYALSRVARDAIGTDNVDFRLAPRTDEERPVLGAVAGTTGPTLDQLEAAETVVVAGLDPEEEVPVLHLRLRKAWRTRRQRIVVVGPTLGALAEIAWRWIPTLPGEEAAALSGLRTGEGVPTDQLLGDGELIVLAGERLAWAPGALAEAAALARSRDGAFAWVPRRSGARGALDAGLLPGLLPGGRTLDDPGPVADLWSRLPDGPGRDTRSMLEAAATGELKALYLVGVDIVTDFEEPDLARAALERAELVIVQDLLPTATTALADVLLPARAPQERVGSFTTWEGRRQPFGQAVPAPGQTQQDWDISRQLARALGHDLGWETAQDVRTEAAQLMDVDSQPDRLDVAIAARPDVEAPARPDEGELVAALRPNLLAPSTTLDGADTLLATRRPAVAWLHPTDAERLDITHGSRVEVAGPGGRLELTVHLREDLAVGAVGLPLTGTDVRVGTLREGPGPLHVTVRPVTADEAVPMTESGA